MNQNEFDNLNHLFRGAAFNNKDDRSHHCITTDHPYMNKIGLGVFTTGELYSWMTRTNSQQELINLPLIGSPLVRLPNNEDELISILKQATERLLHGGTSQSDVNNYFFSAWRSYGRGGSYTKYYGTAIDGGNWDYTSSNGLTFDKSNLDFGFFSDKECVFKTSLPFAEFFPKKNLDSKICNLLVMNDYARIVLIPPEQEVNPTNNIFKTAIAVREFITDIKASQEKCVTWSGVVDFNLNLGVPVVDNFCIKPEWVTYKLFLYDETYSRDDARKLAINLNSLKIVGPPKDATGRTGTDSANPGLTPPSITPNPANSIAGNLRLVADSITGNWESGTQQIVAQLITDIEPGSPVPVDTNESASLSSLIDPAVSHHVKQGKALQLKSYDNPILVAPALDGVGENLENKKQEVDVINLSEREFKRGETVMLSLINGAWVVSPLQDPVKETAPKIGKWEFCYLMTNADHFFRTYEMYKNSLIVKGTNLEYNNLYTSEDVVNLGQAFTFQEYEQAFRFAYYSASFPSPSHPIWGGELGEGAATYYRYANANYVQVTSFDFMGPDVGGLREDNAIGSTLFLEDINGTPYDDDGKRTDGMATAPFFGCIFPDGYQIDDVSKYKSISNIKYVPSAEPEYGKFLKEISTGTMIFKDNNGLKYPGLFSKSDDINFKHLPADIATNSSPGGVNGSPIKNNSEIPRAIIWKQPENRLPNKVREYFNSQRAFFWLHEENDPNKSLFDLQPVRNRVISFRPLKAEVFASLETGNEYINTNESFFGPKFKYELLRGDYKQIFFNDTRSRWRVPNFTHFRINAHHKKRGGQSVDFQEDTFIYNGFKLDGDPSTFGPPVNMIINLPGRYSEAKFPDNFWNQDWMLTDDDRGAGVVGIIAAQCVLETSSDKIVFKTKNHLGMDSYFRNGKWFPSWGGYGGNLYNDLHTTQLYVRIYHAWPKELTIYDPQFFAIMHFNDGVSLTGVKNENGIDVTESNVDIRIPTKSDGDVLPTGVLISSSNPQLLNKNSWKIDPQRRGKLLPYSYEFLTIGIGNEVFIVSGGTQYKNNDKFTTSGGAGSGVELNALTDNGSITGFQIINRGYNFIPQDFLPSAANAKSRVKIVPANNSVGGKNFEGYVKFGLSYKAGGLDQKPKQVSTESYFQLTPNPTGVSDETGGSPGFIPITNIEKETVVEISNKNKDKKYDLFFHFHNDITHTFALEWGTSPLAFEQDVTLEISI